MVFHLRIARPVSHLARSRDRYAQGLALAVFRSFVYPDGHRAVLPHAAWEHTRD